MSSLPKKLGEYHLTKCVGKGVLFEFWSADDSRSNQPVMLEIPASRHLLDKGIASLLHAEFENSQIFDQTHLLKARESRVVNGVPFIVRDYFLAKTLRQMMGGVNQDKVIQNLQSLAFQMAAGLQHMHERKWIHGNLNPSCFLLSPDFHVKLTGLYAARRFPQSKMTSWFSAKYPSGTLNYASPEQIQERQVDARSDIYNLGCILFELLEGKAPYSGKSQSELLNKHVAGAIPRVAKLHECVPKQIEDLVYQMMQKNPSDRPNSMLIVQHELNGIFQKEIAFTESFVARRSTQEASDSHAQTVHTNFGSILELEKRSHAPKTNPSFATKLLASTQAWLMRQWVGVVCLLAVALIAGSIYGVRWSRLSESSKEAEYLRMFRGFVEAMESSPKGKQSADKKNDWDALGGQINVAVEKYMVEMEQGSAQRPDRLELGWAANLLPRAYMDRTEPMGRDDILNVVKSHLDNAEMHKQRMEAKNEKDWKRRRRIVDKWVESDVVFWALVGLNVVAGTVLVRLFLKRR